MVSNLMLDHLQSESLALHLFVWHLYHYICFSLDYYKLLVNHMFGTICLIFQYVNDDYIVSTTSVFFFLLDHLQSASFVLLILMGCHCLLLNLAHWLACFFWNATGFFKNFYSSYIEVGGWF